MSEISFNEEPEYVSRPSVVRQSPFIKIALSSGIVSTVRGANRILIGVAAIATVLAFVVPSLITPSSHLTPEQRAFINANPPARK